MSNHIQAVKGTKDILPEAAAAWQHVEAAARKFMALYRYRELRTPIFEATALFQRGIGEGTDIVGKEMYTFQKGDHSLTLRPENTAGVVRAYIEHKLYVQPSPQKLWYMGPMFRAEAPQALRQRQFHQLGVECLGSEDPRWDAEIIALALAFMTSLELPGLELQLNSIGDIECRASHRGALQTYLRVHAAELCETCRTRTDTNPLRTLDCKVPKCQPVLNAAPTIAGYLSEASLAHQAAVEGYLAAIELPFRRNERLVRGLDYYSRTVFEIVSTDAAMGSQNTVCAGGRYNGLVEELGGPTTPAVGWGLGLERLLALMPKTGLPQQPALAMVMATSPGGSVKAFQLAQQLRGLGQAVELSSGGKLDKQFKQADRLNARYALLLGEDELAAGEISIKDLSSREQVKVKLEAQAIASELARMAAGSAVGGG